MIPANRVRADRISFPFLGLAMAVLAFYAIIAVLVPPSPLRAAFAVAAFFAMGYSALALVAGDYLRLSAAEVFAFTVGLTILITSLSALAVSIIGIPITEFAVIIVGLPIGVITWIVRGPRMHPFHAARDFLRHFFDFSDYNRSEKGIAAALFAAVMATLVVLLAFSFLEYPENFSVGIAITGSDGKPGSLPRSFIRGEPQTIIVTVLANATAGSYLVRIRLIPENATGGDDPSPCDSGGTFHCIPPSSPLMFDSFAEYREPITLAARGTWTKSFSIALDAAGAFVVRFEVLDSRDQVKATNLLHVPVA